MSENKSPREFWITTINGKAAHVGETKRIRGTKWESTGCKDIHVIEKSSFDKAIEAFRKYGRHVEYCKSKTGFDCDCGFSTTLKELGEI